MVAHELCLSCNRLLLLNLILNALLSILFIQSSNLKFIVVGGFWSSLARGLARGGTVAR